jgi:glutathione S-transferase
MTLTLYHQPGACSLASHILLEEAGLDYEAVHIDIHSGQNRAAEYLKINPKGRIPALRHGAEIITESPAILSYISGLVPDRAYLPEALIERSRVLEWMNWLSGSLHAVAFAALIHPDWFATSDAAQAEVKAKGATQVAEHFAAINQRLRGHDWAVGNTFTLVDPYLLVFYTWGCIFGMPMADYGHYRNHALRMNARPAVAKVMQAESVEAIG